MRILKALIALALAGLSGLSVAPAGSDLNEVGAMLVFPTVAAMKQIVCVPVGGEGEDECDCDIPGCDCECLCDDSGCGCVCTGTACTACQTQQTECEGDGGGGVICSEVVSTETFITITNAGPNPRIAHVSYINGFQGSPVQEDTFGAGATSGTTATAATATVNAAGATPDVVLPETTSLEYCNECDFDIPLTPNDTETLVLTFDANGLVVLSEDSGQSISCPFPYGMMVVTLEDANGVTSTENVLLGEEVVVDYLSGSAFSIPAVPFQGGSGGDGDRIYRLDDSEYGKMPRVVAANFLAPNSASQATSTAVLSLFTLGFERGWPPLADCSVTGFDASERPFSASFQFGCWEIVDLCSITPELCYPNLGLVSNGDTHGWLQLNCRVDQDPSRANGFDAQGGVHGALIQFQGLGSSLPAGNGATFAGAAAWGQLLHQSVTTGDAVTLHLGGTAPGMF